FGCDRSAIEPESISKFATCPIVAGSMPVGNVVDVPTLASVEARRAETAEKSGSDVSWVASSGENVENCDPVNIRSDLIVRSRTAVTDAFSDAANTATNVTRP